jgi:transposase InsO family protein
MQEIHKLGKRQKEPQPPRGLARRIGKHPFEVRLKAVKLRLEEGFPAELIAHELGVGQSTLSAWTKRYREQGEVGLRSTVHSDGHGKSKIAPAVKQRITELKRQHPRLGVKKIAQVLRRMLFLSASHETVRRTLHQHRLIHKPKTKPRRNPPKPRFFERDTPNQMWQSDIFTFRLGGKNAYLIGFIDDHSRYIVGLDLFRSQTAEHVLEVYRTAVAEYGLPKEMLTDNGRQYTAWHGKTRFQQELRKDHVHHFKSQPHHPMTLGKIERFWKTIWADFLVRAQFDSFEQARERVRWWVKYYNHKRTHQSLEGLCPADRFFAIAKELRAVIERGIAENVQELALRGQPQSPFYMVGRLGQQSVVLRAEKGKVKMEIDGQETEPNPQLTYQLKGEPIHDDRTQTPEGTPAVSGGPTRPGGAERVDGAAATGRDLSGTEHHDGAAGGLAGAGDARDAGGTGAAPLFVRPGPGADRETGAVVESPDTGEGSKDVETGETAGQTPTGTGGDVGPGQINPKEEHETQTCVGGAGATGTTAGGADCAGAERGDHGNGGGPATGDLPQDVLRVGAAGTAGSGGGVARPAGGPPSDADRTGRPGAGATGAGIGQTAAGVGDDAGDSPTTDGMGAH